MPGKKHLRGVSAKEQREYEHIKESAQKSGRYGRRAKEVAARTVLKQHKSERPLQGALNGLAKASSPAAPPGVSLNTVFTVLRTETVPSILNSVILVRGSATL